MDDGSEPAVGSVKAKQPISSPAAIAREPLFLLRFAAPAVDRRHRQGALDGHEGADAGIAGLEFHGCESVFDGGAARAAVALQMHAKDSELAEFRRQFPREQCLLVPPADVRADPLVGKIAYLLTNLQFLGGQEGIEGKDIGGIRR
jgi:hypothetical protein